jgi:hypothetical protein
MPFDRRRSVENELLDAVAEYPKAPSNLEPEIVAKFEAIVRSAPPGFWRARAEALQIVNLARCEHLLDRVSAQMMVSPVCIGDKVNPLFSVYTRLSSLSSMLRNTLGLTVLAGQSVGARSVAGRKLDAAAAPPADPWETAHRSRLRAVT